jgi:hypothetical protein
MPARRSAPDSSQARRFGTGGRGWLTLPGLAVVLALGPALTLLGCGDLPLQKEGQSCGGAYGGCAKGLRCSFKKKRCYRPVDCAHLDRKVKACLSEVVSEYAPGLAKVPAQKRTRLLERIGQHLQTEVVDHCKYDAAAYQKKNATIPTQTKSYGEDPRAKEIAACLHKQECRPFARCLLGLARVVGPGRASPKNPPVFPVSPPRPTPATAPDAKNPLPMTQPAMPAMPTKAADPTKAAMPVVPVKRPMVAKPAPRPR